MSSKSQPFIVAPRHQQRWSYSIWPFYRRRSRLLCALAAAVCIVVTYLLTSILRPKDTISRTRLHPQKPPLVDRFRMERLGIYDESEPADQEWMGSRALHFSNIKRDPRNVPLSVTALPDSRPAKHSRLMSNALADWRLCGSKDSPCRLILVRLSPSSLRLCC